METFKELPDLLAANSKKNFTDSSSFSPVFFRAKSTLDQENLIKLLRDKPYIKVKNTLYSQLREYIRSNNPAKRLDEKEIESLISNHIGSVPWEEYGVWVYYPWSENLVHILDEDEFVALRTTRNKYKITDPEQEILRTKKIGIVGLSVGQSIALTLAMERTCGEIRLADFDVAELSNLNRIRTGVENLEINKAIITAREISEIDPFIKIKVFTEGLTGENMQAFFEESGRLDLCIEVCDGLDIKIEARLKARELRIPVVMDTNDRGMIDIERFDLEPNRPILHGLIGDIDTGSLKKLSNEEKIPLIVKIANAPNASVRGKASMVEVGQSISTWPQLASSVVLGGAVTTDVCRRILLGQLEVSGRFYVDIEELINNQGHPDTGLSTRNPYLPLSKNEIESYIEDAFAVYKSSYILSDKELQELLNAAIAAPSTGNDQPWKFGFTNGILYVFHEKFQSFSFGDFKNIASYLTFGAVYENLHLKAAELGIEANGHLYPLGEESPLVLAFEFSKGLNPGSYEGLSAYIYDRHTNRNIEPYSKIEDNILKQLQEIAKSIPGADLKFLTERGSINSIGEVIGACDKLRILNKAGHDDFVNREMRWDNPDSPDGISVKSLGLSESQITALEIIKDSKVIDFLRDIKGGKILQKATVQSIGVSSAIGLISMPGTSARDFIPGGRSMERVWLAAEKFGLAVHPVISPLYFFPRLKYRQEETGLSYEELADLKTLRKKFLKIFEIEEGLGEIFLFKLFIPEKPAIKAPRRPLEEVLIKL